MNNLLLNFDQVIIAFFAVVVMCYTFAALNRCSKYTRLVVRIPHILFFTASVSVLVSISTGVLIPWIYGVWMIAVAFHLVGDRRSPRTEIYQHPQPK